MIIKQKETRQDKLNKEVIRSVQEKEMVVAKMMMV
jgi:hypothetical protein